MLGGEGGNRAQRFCADFVSFLSLPYIACDLGSGGVGVLLVDFDGSQKELFLHRLRALAGGDGFGNDKIEDCEGGEADEGCHRHDVPSSFGGGGDHYFF